MQWSVGIYCDFKSLDKFKSNSRFSRKFCKMECNKLLPINNEQKKENIHEYMVGICLLYLYLLFHQWNWKKTLSFSVAQTEVQLKVVNNICNVWIPIRVEQWTLEIIRNWSE